jgi:1,4-alpha-glucan branching enzyme
MSIKGTRRVRFEITAAPRSKISVAGTFNDWKPGVNLLKEKDGNGVYERTLFLPVGRYEYKFVVNDTWCIDPACKEWVANDFGTLNSVLKVG